MKNLFKTKFDVAVIVLIPACIGINYLGKLFASVLKLPLWLDSIGTCIGGCLGGPIIGAICGAASLSEALGLIEVLERILTPWGLAFQLRDDDLGVFGDPALTGKPAGDDLREGKRTALLALTWEASSPTERRALTDVLGVAEASAGQIEEAKQIVERNGLAAHEAEIARLVRDGHEALETSGIDADAAIMLQELCDILTARRA